MKKIYADVEKRPCVTIVKTAGTSTTFVLSLPTRAIQLSGEVLSTDEAASAELHEAEAVHRTHSSRHLFKAITPCVC